MFSNASLAMTSVTGPAAIYRPDFNGVSPTIVIADPETFYRYETKQGDTMDRGFFRAQGHKRLLAQLARGTMPASSKPQGHVSPRLIYTYNVSRPRSLRNLRIFTGARVIVGLTDPSVAGAISQTNPLDYRDVAHFGAPLSSVEFKLLEVPGSDIAAEEPAGKLVVTGPAVIGGEAVVEGKNFRVTESHTLTYG